MTMSNNSNKGESTEGPCVRVTADGENLRVAEALNYMRERTKVQFLYAHARLSYMRECIALHPSIDVSFVYGIGVHLVRSRI